MFPPSTTPVKVLKACDIGSIDVMVAEAEGLQEYRHATNGWHSGSRRQARRSAPTRWTHAPEAPVELAVVSHALRGGSPARLNLVIDTSAVCDPRVHPEVVHVGAQGRLAWKGRDTARLSLALYAPPPVPLEAGAAAPGIAAPSASDLQSVTIASCGLRDAGAPFGAVALQVRVYPATQWLTEVRHPAWPPMLWPSPGRSIRRRRVRLQAGEGRCAVRRQRLAALLGGSASVVSAAMERLYNEWARSIDGGCRAARGRGLAAGRAGRFSWGWRRTDPATVELRTEGVLDLLALSLEFRLSGELIDGARGRASVFTARGEASCA